MSKSEDYMNFSEWFNSEEAFFLIESFKGIPEAMVKGLAKKMVKNSVHEAKAFVEKQNEDEFTAKKHSRYNQILEKLEKETTDMSPEKVKEVEEKAKNILEKEIRDLIERFQYYNGYQENWWMKEHQSDDNPGMRLKNFILKPKDIDFKDRRFIDKYEYYNQLKQVVDRAGFIGATKGASQSTIKAVVERMIKNGGDPIECKAYVEGFETYKDKFMKKFKTLKKFQEFLQQNPDPNNKEILGLGDIQVGGYYRNNNPENNNPESGIFIPEIKPEERYDITKYSYFEQVRDIKVAMENLWNKISAKATAQLTGEQQSARDIERATLLADIPKPVDNEKVVIYAPRMANDAILVRDNAVDAPNERKPTWCIAWKNHNNQFNKYKFTDKFTFYIILNKEAKNPLETEFDFFVIEAQPRIGDKENPINYYTTNRSNTGEVLMTWENIVKLAPYIKDYKDVFVPVPLKKEELNMKNKYDDSPITAEQWERLEDADKKFYLDLFAIKQDLSIDVFNTMSKEFQKLYLGYMNTRNEKVVNTILEKAKQGETGAAARHAEIAKRLAEEGHFSNEGAPAPKNDAYAKLMVMFWQKMTVLAISKTNKYLFNQIYKNLPDQDMIFEKIKSENDSNSKIDLLGKLNDENKVLYLKTKIKQEGLGIISDDFYILLIKRLSAESLAQFFDEYKINNIFTAVKDASKLFDTKNNQMNISEIAKWSQVLKTQNFKDIIRWIPSNIIGQFNNKDLINSFLVSDEESVKDVIEFFKEKHKFNHLVSHFIPVKESNSFASDFINLFKLNPSRFLQNIDDKYFASMSSAALNHILVNLGDIKLSTIVGNNYLAQNGPLHAEILQNLIRYNENKLETAKNITQKIPNYTGNIVNEIILAFDTKEFKQAAEILGNNIEMLNKSQVINLITLKGPKVVRDTLGDEVYYKIEEEDPEHEEAATNMFKKIRSKYEDFIPSDDEQTAGDKEQPEEDSAQANYLDLLRLSKKPFSVRGAEDWIWPSWSAKQKMKVIDELLKRKDIDLTSDDISGILRGSPLIDDTLTKLGEHNPKNLEILRDFSKLDPMRYLNLPAKFLDKQKFIDIYGQEKAKEFLEKIFQAIRSAYPDGYKEKPKLNTNFTKIGIVVKSYQDLGRNYYAEIYDIARRLGMQLRKSPDDKFPETLAELIKSVKT
jgi:hypothetical protein